MSKSPNIGLNLISSDDIGTNVKEWALKINGDSVDSNALLIDQEIALLKEGITDSIPISEKGVANGVPTLDDLGKIPSQQLPEMNYDPAGSAMTVQTNLEIELMDVNDNIIRVEQIAKGANRAKVFATLVELDTWLTNEINRTSLQVGDNLYIIARDASDYWWDGLQKQELETGKVDLIDYPKTIEVQNMISTFATEVNLQLSNKADKSEVEVVADTVNLANRWVKLYEKVTTSASSAVELVFSQNNINVADYLSLRVYCCEGTPLAGIKLQINDHSNASSYVRVHGTTTTNQNAVADEGSYVEIDLGTLNVCIRGGVYFWRMANLKPSAMQYITLLPYTGSIMSAGTRIVLLGLKR